jgi:hypothetical protein
MGYFPTKVVEPESPRAKGQEKAKAKREGAARRGKKRKSSTSTSRSPAWRPGEAQGPDHLHPAVGDPGGCRSAAVARVARARTAGKNPPSKRHHRRSGQWRSRAAARSPRAGPASQDLQPAVVNMVKAGELGGVLEVVLNRLAEFMEKAEKIKGKVIAAMFYPVGRHHRGRGHPGDSHGVRDPKFEQIFKDMLEGRRFAGVHGVRAEHQPTISATTSVLTICQRGRRSSFFFGSFLKTEVRTKGSSTSSSSFPRARPGGQQGGHLPVHPHPGHPGQQRRAHSPGAHHRQGNLRQRHHQQGRGRRA